MGASLAEDIEKGQGREHVDTPLPDHLPALQSFIECAKTRLHRALESVIREPACQEPGVLRAPPWPPPRPGAGTASRQGHGTALPRSTSRCLFPGGGAPGGVIKWRPRRGAAGRAVASAATICLLTFETLGGSAGSHHITWGGNALSATKPACSSFWGFHHLSGRARSA